MAFTLELPAARKSTTWTRRLCAVERFMTYDVRQTFSDFFGNTITKLFRRCGLLSQPMLEHRYERAVRKALRQKAVLYYPALWYDIGPETQAAVSPFSVCAPS